MPPTSAVLDCRRFADATIAAGGTVPDPLRGLLVAASLLMRPAATTTRYTEAHPRPGNGRPTRRTQARDAARRRRAPQQAATYRRELRTRAEPVVVPAFHQALKDGAADQILDSLRPQFEKAAAQIEAARGLIAAESDLAQWLSTAKPEAVTAWQALDGHLATVSAIGAIAAQFGPRVGNFPLIVEYALADNFRIDDRAVFCADGPHIEIDSAAFQRSTAGHRGSPWFKVSLKLNTVAEAQERYRIFAGASWERVHGGRRESWIDGDGEAHEMPRPENPFTAKVPTT